MVKIENAASRLPLGRSTVVAVNEFVCVRLFEIFPTLEHYRQHYYLKQVHGHVVRVVSVFAGMQVLIIGGGIANFTDVAATFTGIITALKQYAEELRDGNISIWVRRAGPNYQEVRVCMRREATQMRSRPSVSAKAHVRPAILSCTLGALGVNP